MRNTQQKIILDLCGGTGAWSAPYSEAGFEVKVITLPDYDITNTSFGSGKFGNIEFRGKHNDTNQKSVLVDVKDIYGVLAAPPCTQFSFARTNAVKERDLEEGMKIVRACLHVIWYIMLHIEKDTQKYPPLKFWALENPNRGMLKWFLGKPAFVFNPYDFGDDYKKETALWGYFNEPIRTPIKPTGVKFDYMKSKDIHPEYFGKYDRQTRRSITPKGFAQAFYKVNSETSSDKRSK